MTYVTIQKLREVLLEADVTIQYPVMLYSTVNSNTTGVDIDLGEK